MEEIFRTDFFISFFDEKNEVLKNVWTEKTKIANMEMMKELNLLILEKIKEYKPKRLLIDARDFMFPIVPKLQEWYNKNIPYQYLESGMNSLAMIMSNDFISELSLEQLLEEEAVSTMLKPKYFTTEIEAIKWLCEN